jgi:hypothetical protein
MARKVVNRKALREEADAAEKIEKAAKSSKSKDDKPAKEKAAPKKKGKKDPEAIRVKLFWGVFNQNMKRIALFEYSQKKQADTKAAELSAGANKSQHFVQRVKEEVATKVD